MNESNRSPAPRPNESERKPAPLPHGKRSGGPSLPGSEMHPRSSMPPRPGQRQDRLLPGLSDPTPLGSRPGEMPSARVQEPALTPDVMPAPVGQAPRKSAPRIKRRGFLAGLAGVVGAAVGVWSSMDGDSSQPHKEDQAPPPNPTKESGVSRTTAVPAVIEPTTTAPPVIAEAQSTLAAQATKETKETKARGLKEIPEDVISEEDLARMNIRILNSPNWDWLIRKGAIEHSPTLQWVQNKDAKESEEMLERHAAVVKKSMAGEALTGEERKLINRLSTPVNRYYPNRSVTYVVVDGSMITEEAMTPEQRDTIPADVMRKVRQQQEEMGIAGGQYLYSPIGSDKKSVECFIFITTQSVWNDEKYTSDQSFPRTDVDVFLDETQTDPTSVLYQYPLRARTKKGKNPTLTGRHEDAHIDADHPETDRKVYEGLKSATEALNRGDDSQYYYVLVKKGSGGKPEEVLVGQDQSVLNIAA